MENEPGDVGSVSGVVDTGELSEEKLVDQLVSSEETEETTEETEEEETTEEETEENESTEEEEKEPKSKEDEDEPETQEVHGVNFKDLKAKYPNLFKDFPSLKPAFFLGRDVSKLFPSLDDAKEAHFKSQQFDNMEAELMEGQSQNLLKAVASLNTDSAVKLARNFLPTVMGLSKDLYFEITSPVVEDALRAAYAQGVKLGNENLKNAAEHLSKLFFEDAERVTKGREQPKEDPERQKLTQEKRQFFAERHNLFRSEIDNSVGTSLRTEVSKGLE